MRATILLLANFVVFNVGLIALINKPANEKHQQRPPVHQELHTPVPPQPEPKQYNYDLSDPFPDYLNYDQTVAKLKEWHQEAPEITEVGTYGKSSRGKDLYYIRIRSTNGDDVKPKVMITACIHGNEPLSASTTMCYIGTILDKYGDDPNITKMVDERDLYFVPVVSPDSYPHSRHVDGVDPNRNFPTRRNPSKRSVPPVQELREFFLEVKPNAIISGHTWGRVYLTPWGDQTRLCPNDADFKRVIGEMGRLSQYRVQRACQMYNRPIYGTEVDWYYRNGAFAIVMEFGTHQRVPSPSDIKTEFDRTWKAVQHFIEEAPVVEIRYFRVSDWRQAA